mmetsp:Transcript_35233/g.89174  ORF Transcript_35233/g.89174 Transcript_35233/m.89174 type:complete len:222 (-) Transcript_35233:143-808(-)
MAATSNAEGVHDHGTSDSRHLLLPIQLLHQAQRKFESSARASAGGQRAIHHHALRHSPLLPKLVGEGGVRGGLGASGDQALRLQEHGGRGADGGVQPPRALLRRHQGGEVRAVAQALRTRHAARQGDEVKGLTGRHVLHEYVSHQLDAARALDLQAVLHRGHHHLSTCTPQHINHNYCLHIFAPCSDGHQHALSRSSCCPSGHGADAFSRVRSVAGCRKTL